MTLSFSRLSIILGIKAVLMIAFIIGGSVALAPDEAQYWTWSQALDWGYYSKPPGIAYQMALGTWLFGNTELGVRFGAVILAVLMPLAVYRCAVNAGTKENTAAWAGVIMALTPIGLLASLLATTDGGFIVFWTLAVGELASAIRANRAPRYFVLGAFVAAGALFKWPAYLVWAVVAVGWLAFPPWRSVAALGGMVISLLGLAPSFLWNAQHGWPTFRHVGSTLVVPEAARQAQKFIAGNPGDFFGAQVALVSPVIFVLLLIAAWTHLRRGGGRIPRGVAFCGTLSIAIVALHLVAAFTKKIQGNWCVYAYPPGFVLVAWYAFEEVYRARRWVVAGLALSLLGTGVGLALPAAQKHGVAGMGSLPYKANPWRNALGWERIEDALVDAGWDPKTEFLFGHKYQTASLLSFYNPAKQRGYFFNIFGARKNQFSYWDQMTDKQVGTTGYFVWAENVDRIEGDKAMVIAQYQNVLGDYFDRVSFVGEYPLYEVAGTTAKAAYLYRCVGYNGRTPPEVDSY